MKPNTYLNPMDSAEDPDSIQAPLRIPSFSTLLHVLWLRKWTIVAAWVFLAVPVGVLLSLYNLPASYQARTVLRFPAVVGAQINVMRDVAITRQSSIITIFNSFHVLESTIQKRYLRLQIKTPNVFHHNTFKRVRYGENVAEGQYEITFQGKGKVEVILIPKGARNSFPIFAGPLEDGNRLKVSGMELEFSDKFLRQANDFKLEMKLKSLEQTIKDLSESVKIRPIGEENFEIVLKDRDPWLVSEVLNTMREEFLNVYYGTTEVQDVGILVQMEKDLEIAKNKLGKTQDELANYYGAHPSLLRGKEERNRGDDFLYAELTTQLDLLKSKRRKLQTTMAAKPSQEGEEKQFWIQELLSVMGEAGEPKANILRSTLFNLEKKAVEYRATLGPEHPKILEIKEQKEDVYRQLEGAYGVLMKNIGESEAELRLKTAQAMPANSARPSVKVELELERLITANRNAEDIYDNLQASYNRAKLTTGAEFFKVTVVDKARPAHYEPPSLKKRLLAAAAAMFLLAAILPALFCLWQILFLKIWTRDDAKKFLGLKTLGATRFKKPSATGNLGLNKGPMGTREVDPLLLFLGKGYLMEDVEAFRQIREECENHFKSSAPSEKLCLMVTSTQPGDGKSICASNLAMAFARKGRKTLLIDGDFRLGRVASIFALNVETGLDDMLSQDFANDQVFRAAVFQVLQHTAQSDLFIVPRRISVPNAAELISSTKFRAFLELAKEEFDVVLVDTPPLMVAPEPLSLVEMCDGVVYILRSGANSLGEAREAIAGLCDRNARIGCILNAMKISPTARNRYQKYSYYYQVQAK